MEFESYGFLAISLIIYKNGATLYLNFVFLYLGGPSGLPQVGRPAGFKKTGTGIQLNTK